MSTNDETEELKSLRKTIKNLKVYSLVDLREVDTYIGMSIFLHEKHAIEMKKSMGSDSEHFFVHEIKVIT